VEAASNAEKVMSQPAAPVQTAAAAPAVQRHAADETEVQAAHDPSLPTVQREGEEEEEAQASHDPSLGPVQREEAEEEESQE
jgi:hypothetical protein